MKPVAILLLLAITVSHSPAQETSRKDLQSIVDVERSFIKMAKEKNTRDAFMVFLADDAVTIGKEPRIGKEYLQKQTPNESWLLWEPVYSDISSSGDFGFNTGPWEYRNSKLDGKAVAFGQFVTVWKKVNGEWKAAIDMGIGHGEHTLKEKWKTSAIALKPQASNKTTTAGILSAEKNFLKRFETTGASAYFDAISDEIRVYRGGSEPMISSGEKQNYFEHFKTKFVFTPLGGETSSTDDMGFVYGKCSVEESVEGKLTARQSHYLRIWKKENSEWRIVLDLVQ